MIYVLYQLINIEGSGHQPYRAVGDAGSRFDGGHYGRDGVYLGYVSDERGLTAMRPWLVDVLTADQARAWAESVVPVNSVIEGPDEKGYVGPAELDEKGYVTRRMAAKPWADVSPRQMPMLERARAEVSKARSVEELRSVVMKLVERVYQRGERIEL